MGNCFAKCCGKFGRRKKYLQTRFTERKQSIEFENLMDDESVTAQQDMGRLITDHEQQLLRAGRFEAIVHEQCQIDRLLEEQLAEQEEDLRRREEAAYEAKREAVRIARLQRSKEKTGKKTTTINGARAWLADDEEWDVSGDREEDFGVFLANVKARSLAARAQIHAGQGDCQSSSSSNAHTKDRSLTEGSSLDLEWDHEAGMEPVQRPRSHTEEILEDLTSLQNMAGTTGGSGGGGGGGSQHSSDLEWDDSFLTSDDYEQRQLLGVHNWSRSVR